MPEIQLVSYVGFKVLVLLAGSEPEIFAAGDPVALRQRMKEVGRSEHGPDAELYGDRFDMSISLASLNAVAQSGPASDADYALVIRQAVGSSTAQASNQLLWATINCFELAQYIPMRWASSNLSQTSPNFVVRHWLKYSRSDGRKWNASARLWWLGEMATRAAEHSRHSFDVLLKAVTGNVGLYHQITSRPSLSANPMLVAAIWDIFLDGNAHLRTTKNANELMKALNRRSAIMFFDSWAYSELRAVVETIKPPKN